MRLRKLEHKDAPFMLEWMHDEDVVRNMRRDFMSMTLDDCISFIDSAWDSSENLHMAVADDQDEYMGTVSLKNIHDGIAEFGITVRSCAMGKGFSKFAMDSIIELGFDCLGLKEIYWCVDPKNTRAIRFYDKNGYTRSSSPENGNYSEEEMRRYIWYKKEKTAAGIR